MCLCILKLKRTPVNNHGVVKGCKKKKKRMIQTSHQIVLWHLRLFSLHPIIPSPLIPSHPSRKWCHPPPKKPLLVQMLALSRWGWGLYSSTRRGNWFYQRDVGETPGASTNLAMSSNGWRLLKLVNPRKCQWEWRIRKICVLQKNNSVFLSQYQWVLYWKDILAHILLTKTQSLMGSYYIEVTTPNKKNW